MNKLTVNVEDGSKAVINVLDIIDSNSYGKSYIIYTFEPENRTIYASILVENEDSFYLDPIESQEEINFIDGEIDRFTITK